MRYYKFGYILFFVLLTSCVTAKDTIVPAPTFQQYSSSPMFFRSVEIHDHLSPKSSKNFETKLRNGFSSYSRARFVADSSYANDLKIEPLQLDVTKAYLQVGGKNDLFSAWKSYDQYILSSKIKMSLTCSHVSKALFETVTVTKTTKIPASYSPYERDIHLLGVLEEHIFNIDEALIKTLNASLAGC